MPANCESPRLDPTKTTRFVEDVLSMAGDIFDQRYGGLLTLDDEFRALQEVMWRGFPHLLSSAGLRHGYKKPYTRARWRCFLDDLRLYREGLELPERGSLSWLEIEGSGGRAACARDREQALFVIESLRLLPLKPMLYDGPEPRLRTHIYPHATHAHSILLDNANDGGLLADPSPVGKTFHITDDDGLEARLEVVCDCRLGCQAKVGKPCPAGLGEECYFLGEPQLMARGNVRGYTTDKPSGKTGIGLRAEYIGIEVRDGRIEELVYYHTPEYEEAQRKFPRWQGYFRARDAWEVERSELENDFVQYLHDRLTGKAFEDYYPFPGMLIHRMTDWGQTARELEGTAAIDFMAFEGCTSLTTFSIPNGVREIGEMAFYGCTSLASVSVPEGVKEVGDLAFARCLSLGSVSISGDGVRVGVGAFRRCSSLSRVEIAGSVESIGPIAFYGCTSLASVSIPEGASEIGDGAFAGCSSLSRVEIPLSVASVGQGALEGCALPWEGCGLQVVSGWAVSCRLDASAVSIPAGTRGVADGAFAGCASLSSLEVPEGLALIGDGAFAGCASLDTVRVGGPESARAVSDAGLWGPAAAAELEACRPGEPSGPAWEGLASWALEHPSAAYEAAQSRPEVLAWLISSGVADPTAPETAPGSSGRE